MDDRLRALAGQGAAFLRWWKGELAPLVPAQLRGRGQTTAEIHLYTDRTELHRLTPQTGEKYVEARPIEAFDDDAWAELTSLIEGVLTSLILSSPDSFINQTLLPKAALARVRSAIALQLPRLSPLRADLIAWGYAVRINGRDRISVDVAMVRIERLQQLRSLFAEAGLALPAIVAQRGDQRVRIAEAEAVSASTEAKRRRILHLVAIALIASIPFTTGAGAAINESVNTGMIDRLQEDVRPKLERERHARESERARAALRVVAQTPAVAPVIESLAASLPGDAYLTALSLDGRRISFTVSAPSAEAVQIALEESGQFEQLDLVDQRPDGDRFELVFEGAGDV